jgi:hypothetical protein
MTMEWYELNEGRGDPRNTGRELTRTERFALVAMQVCALLVVAILIVMGE